MGAFAGISPRSIIDRSSGGVTDGGGGGGDEPRRNLRGYQTSRRAFFARGVERACVPDRPVGDSAQFEVRRGGSRTGSDETADAPLRTSGSSESQGRPKLTLGEPS